MKSTYSISEILDSTTTTEDGLVQEIASNEAQGFGLIDVKYANGYWFGAYGKNIGYGDSREINTDFFGTPDPSAFVEAIASNEANGYYLTDIEYTEEYTNDGRGYWFGIFDTQIVDSEIVVAETVGDFNSQVAELRSLYPNDISRYHLVDFEYTGSQYIGVINRTFGNSTYVGSENFAEFEAEVNYQQSQGLELTNLEYIDGTYVGIYSDTLTGASIYSPNTGTFDDPEFAANINSFEGEVEYYRSIGYDLINVESIEGEWFGIYKEDTDFTDSITPPGELELRETPTDYTIEVDFPDYS